MNRHSIITILLALFAIFDVSAKKKGEYPRAEIKVEYIYPHKHLKMDAKAYDAEYPISVALKRYSAIFNSLLHMGNSVYSFPD